MAVRISGTLMASLLYEQQNSSNNQVQNPVEVI